MTFLNKKYCPQYFQSTYFTSNELLKVFSFRSNRNELVNLKRELDYLDNVEFKNKNVDMPKRFKLKHEESGVYLVENFTKENKSDLNLCIYIPPHKSKSEDSFNVDVILDNCSEKENKVACPEIVSDARREATVLHRVSQLRRQGVWSADRLPKIMEAGFTNDHSVNLLAEVTWMAIDFCEERKWKKDVALKVSKYVFLLFCI